LEAGIAKKIVHHDCYILVVNAVIVDRRFQEMGVLLEPKITLANCSSI
jgi:hypothetical protein